MTRTNGRPIEACGIHEGHKGACVRCARAHAANTDALRDVVPKPAGKDTHWQARTPKAKLEEAQRRYANGEVIAQIARDLGIGPDRVAEAVGTRQRQVRKPNYKSEQGGIKGANARMWARSTRQARDELRATPLPRGTHV